MQLRQPLLALLLTSPLARAGTPAEDAEATYQQAVPALQARDWDAAGRLLEACVKTDPAHGACWWELGWVRYVREDWAGVVEAWETVKRLDPSNTEVDKQLPAARGKVELATLLAGWEKSPPPPRPAPPASAKLRIRAAGDTMMGSDFPEPLMPDDDGAHYFDGVAGLLRDADLTFVNLEGPLCDTGSTTKCKEGSNCYAFRTPTRYGQYLKGAGIDVVSTANNHANDFGEVCRASTESTLQSLDIAYSGRPGTIATLQRNGLDIALIGFHTADSAHNLNDTATAVRLVKALKARHDLVIVSFHGGAEGSQATHVAPGAEMFYGENRGDLRKFTHAVIDAGADLVLGHGPHVARALELYKGHLIAYSMGNFATYGRMNLKGNMGLSYILEVELDSRGRFTGGRVLPTLLEGSGVPEPDPQGQILPVLRELGAADFPDTTPQITDDGHILAPAAKRP